MSTEIEPFRIDVPETVLEDLRARLASTRWPDELPEIGWDQGVPLGYLREICSYWCDDYDWRARERNLNAVPQFRTTVDGLGIHFLHVRSPVEPALPLIMTHGWPGSIVEFMKVIGPLTDPVAHGGDAEDAFHLVCPSLPGYGFSDHPTELGWGPHRIAAAWAELMARLGYQRYGAQGGDWGSVVSPLLAALDPHGCVALHMSPPFIGLPDAAMLESMTDDERAVVEDFARFQQVDAAYMSLQSTRPQTLAYSLNDSPAGQAAWIVEKFWSWTDSDGDPEAVLERDEMLDNVMLYWLNAAAGSSARLYLEAFGGGEAMALPNIETPTGCAIYPRELFRPPRRWVEERYKNLVHWAEMPKGGHFAAFEQPSLFVDDLRAFYRPYRR